MTQRASDERAARRIGGRPRIYAEVKVGDRFGDRTVIETFPRGYRGRSDERVAWRCVCGAAGASWVFNLRGAMNDCRHTNAAGIGSPRGPLERVRLMASGRYRAPGGGITPTDRAALRHLLAEYERLTAAVDKASP
ncbi:MAG: hypothetical protein QOG85_849 [Gaiellaceae bacterium]|jgi:hypothetical protein|nr:hypothetical protein [Gaiellaceae bacterium]